MLKYFWYENYGISSAANTKCLAMAQTKNLFMSCTTVARIVVCGDSCGGSYHCRDRSSNKKCARHARISYHAPLNCALRTSVKPAVCCLLLGTVIDKGGSRPVRRLLYQVQRRSKMQSKMLSLHFFKFQNPLCSDRS